MNIRHVYIGIILSAAFLMGCGSTTKMQEEGKQDATPIVRIGIGSYGENDTGSRHGKSGTGQAIRRKSRGSDAARTCFNQKYVYDVE